MGRQFKASVIRINTIATNVVAFARRASHVLALFFDRNVSATPDMAPERPARLPDCNKTTAIRNTDVSNCTIVNISLSVSKNSPHSSANTQGIQNNI